MAGEIRELKDPQLVHEVARTSLRQLQKAVDKGQRIPMSEFIKIMLWQKENFIESFEKELKKDLQQGWKIESRTWCGVPFNEFDVNKVVSGC